MVWVEHVGVFILVAGEAVEDVGVDVDVDDCVVGDEVVGLVVEVEVGGWGSCGVGFLSGDCAAG